MNPHVVDDAIVKRFLLGDLSQQKQEEVEEQAFLDREFFERLQVAEDDLIDDYLYGDLPSNEKERFEKYFLSKPERYESLRIAKALQRHVSQNTSSASATAKRDQEFPRQRLSFLNFLQARSLIFRFWVAASVLLIVTAGVWFVIRGLRKQDNPAPIQARQQSNQSIQPPQSGQNGGVNANSDMGLQSKDGQNSQEQNQVSSNKVPEAQSVSANSDGRKDDQGKPVLSKQPSTPVYSVLLIPLGPIRGEGEVTPVKLPSNSGVVILKLPLIEETNYRGYQAKLGTDNLSEILIWTKLKATVQGSGKLVQLTVPIRLLQPHQRYRVILSGISSGRTVREISAYYFQVIK